MMGGFGGSNKNIGIGCADGKDGKKWIHTADSGNQWGHRHGRADGAHGGIHQSDH